MKKYIRNSACDDEIYVAVDLSNSETLFLTDLFNKINEARDSGCQPHIKLLDERPESKYIKLNVVDITLTREENK